MNEKTVITITIDNEKSHIDANRKINSFEMIGILRFIEKGLFVQAYSNMNKPATKKTKTKKP